jgi:hypothetical protein
VLQSSSLHMKVGPGWSSAIEDTDVAGVDAVEDEIASYSEPLNDEVDTDVLRRFPRIVPFCVLPIENDEGSCTMNCLGAVPWGRIFAACCLNAAALLMIRN